MCQLLKKAKVKLKIKEQRSQNIKMWWFNKFNEFIENEGMCIDLQKIVEQLVCFHSDQKEDILALLDNVS